MPDRFFRCYNPKCRPVEGSPTDGLEFHAAEPVCPSCKSPFNVLPLVYVHWLVSTGGPMTGADGAMRIACMPERTNLRGLHASGHVTGVNCPKCKQIEAALYDQQLGEHNEANGIIVAKG
jgi:hypothetical protein